MKILHLTDLHVGKERGLKDLWKGLQHAIGGEQKFDFVIISGDLTDRAAPDEYKVLRDFLRGSVLGALRETDPARVVMVPGNHDVLWSSPSVVATECSPEEEEEYGPATISKQLARPELADLRLDDHRRPARLLKRSSSYHSRFAPCSDFLSNFYDDNLLKGDHRPFALTSAVPDDHWSAHVFKRDGVAFYGFNSCWVNDQHWRGAYIPPGAITAARRHADQVGRGLLRVAVWHHGIMGSRGESDFLSLSEMGELVSAGFDLGIHGHTHRDELSEHFEQLRRRFPVVATGSFSAESNDRPDGVRNQASVLDLTPAYLRWRLFDRDAVSGLWEAQNTRELAIRARHVAPRNPPTPKLRSHHRRIRIDGDGIATIDVELRDLELTGDFVLARPRAPHGRCVHDPEAIVQRDKTHWPLPVRVGTSGQPEVVLHDRFENTYDRVTWSYSVSNAFALNAQDLAMGDYGKYADLQLLASHDAVTHEVHAHTEVLTIEVSLPEKVIESAAVRARHRPAERRSSSHEEWLDDPDEGNRTQVSVLEGSRDRVSVTIPYPRLGYRYVLSYALAATQDPTRNETLLLVRRMVKECRDAMSDSPLIARFREALAEGIRGHRSLPADASLGNWVVYLWHDTARQLRPSFGVFPARSWGASFAYGSGIAGHAFRTNRPAVYSSQYVNAPSDSRKARLLYQSAAPDGPLQEHTWLVCLPIVESPTGPAVGVIGFADYAKEPDSEFTKDLRAIAEIACARDASPAAEFATLGSLAHAVSASFWLSLSLIKEGTLSEYNEVAEAIYLEHWAPPPPA